MKYLVCKKENLDKIDQEGQIVENLQDALDKAHSYDTIFLYDDIYYGKYLITTSHLTIIGVNKAKLTYDARNGMIVRNEDGGDGVRTYGTTGSASVTVKDSATYLHLENLIIENSYHRLPGNKGNQNVAFKTEAQYGTYTNIDFISEQDTLYIDASDNFFDSCYIEGDVDFIFGSGDAIINNSKIKMLQILDSNAYLCAPDTYVSNKYGFIFANCQVISTGNNKKYLGRAWYPSGAKELVIPRVLFYNVAFASDIDLRLITMHEGDPINFNYYLVDCKQANNMVNNIDKSKIENYFDYYKIKYNSYLINRLADIILAKECLLYQKAVYIAKMNYAIKDQIIEFQNLKYKLSYLKAKEDILRSVPYNHDIDSLDDKAYKATALNLKEIEDAKSILSMTIEYIETADDVNHEALEYTMRNIIMNYHPYILASCDDVGLKQYNSYVEDFINEDLDELMKAKIDNKPLSSDNTLIKKHIVEIKEEINRIKGEFPFDYIKNGKIDFVTLNNNYDKKIADLKTNIAKVELRLEERAPISGLES